MATRDSISPDVGERPVETPILYSFRRCPYAIRARLAILAANLQVELREIQLKAKPQDFLEASASATVPCLVTADGAIDESLDIMKWALEQHDPEGWLKMPDAGWQWIAETDGPFKSALDRTKYATRYPDCDPAEQRQLASAFLARLDRQIGHWVFDAPTLADFAIFPFVRQFAFIDKAWFDAQPWSGLQTWLERLLVSAQFARVMTKHLPWAAGDDPVMFPGG